jgi:hypothetical protein
MEIVWVTGIYLSLGPYLKSYALNEENLIKTDQECFKNLPIVYFLTEIS